MKKLIVTAVTLALGAALSVSVAAQEKKLSEIHGAAWPKSVNGYVTKQQCMQCHGSYEQLGEKTANLEPNPHKSHMGEVNCEDCHKVDKAKPELMCDQCHQFTIKAKAKPASK